MPKSMASRVVGIGPTWLERRQTGFRNPLGTRDFIYEHIYSSIYPCEFWDPAVNNPNANVHGGVFSLDFSPEGSLLVAACEKRSILLFDPLTYKEIYNVKNAHDGCVNCIKFLDSRSFATCSDDFTVALWDARNLSQKVRSLKGHTNWVKNIEYCSKDGLLVTSGFDGNVLTWEMNKYRESGMIYNKVFATNGLMRMCLTPDASKMVICTTGGYLIVIHNLDLNTLTQDLDGFKPNMYRLMQLSQTILPIASDFTHLFRGYGKRNRVEFITDFPKGDDAEVVSSLQIHPDGHSAISRNVSNCEQSEWSCIHNIEERLSSDESDASDDDDNDCDDYKTLNWSGSSTSISTTPSYIIQHAHVQNDSRRTRSDERNNSEQRDLAVSPADVWEALVAIQEARIRRERDRMIPELSVRQILRRPVADAGILVRPIHSGPDSRIFETRLLPNSNPTDSQERVSPRPENVNPQPVPRRNVSINTVEVGAGSNEPVRPVPTPSTSVTRRKLPPRQRYSSLYRRSLVGQYDRTSISRKPIYRPRLINLKFRRFNNTRLHTNYEMNETQRLQNELNENECQRGSNSGIGSDRPQPGSSGVRPQSSNSRLFIRRRRSAPLRINLSRGGSSASDASTQAVDSTVNSIFNTFRVIESNLNSIRETVTTFEGRINSTLQVLRRSLNLPIPLNDANENRSNSSAGNNNNSSSSSSSNNNNNNNNDNGGGVNNENSYVGNNGGSASGGEASTGSVGNFEVLRNGSEEFGESSDPSRRQSWQDSTNSQDDSPGNGGSVPPPASERTILMGVFRAGSEDGVRGTTMRRHNIAAVTVSSTPQRTSDPSTEVSNRVRTSDWNSNYRNICSKHYANAPVNKEIYQNIKRLTHYIEEPNIGRGFIKEVCISPDGRVICSPFGNGIRLLTFSPTVQELSHCYPHAGPIPLHELSLNMAHSGNVVSTKFSPHHNLLVSGCLAGKIVYYQPLL